jgi:hypothetical protein
MSGVNACIQNSRLSARGNITLNFTSNPLLQLPNPVHLAAAGGGNETASSGPTIRVCQHLIRPCHLRLMLSPDNQKARNLQEEHHFRAAKCTTLRW